MDNFVNTIKIELKKKTPEELSEKICELVTANIINNTIKDKEIKRLKNELAKIPRAKMEYDLEIERLNKGIKELDNMFYETFRISQNGYYSISEWELKDFTNKLKELKEGK